MDMTLGLIFSTLLVGAAVGAFLVYEVIWGIQHGRAAAGWKRRGRGMWFYGLLAVYGMQLSVGWTSDLQAQAPGLRLLVLCAAVVVGLKIDWHWYPHRAPKALTPARPSVQSPQRTR